MATRIGIFLMGEPYQSSLSNVTGIGKHPKVYMHFVSVYVCIFYFVAQLYMNYIYRDIDGYFACFVFYCVSQLCQKYEPTLPGTIPPPENGLL